MAISFSISTRDTSSARGEYTTADAALFPDGMGALERRVTALGLTPGIWTAPFEVGQRSWVYQNHQDWLVHNAKGEPIVAGSIDAKEPIYILDVTNPGAQQYLRRVYITMSRDWVSLHQTRLHGRQRGGGPLLQAADHGVKRSGSGWESFAT